MDTFLINRTMQKNITDLTESIRKSPDLVSADMPVLGTQIAAIHNTYAARLMDLNKVEIEDDGGLIDIEEAANLLGVKEPWIYRRSKKLPFVVRLGRKLKFSRQGIKQYIREQSLN
jgi:excisionase family DNA binding protein